MFDLSAHEDELSNIFKDFSLQVPFVEYQEFDDISREIIKKLDQGAIVAWFVMEVETRGELYLLCGADCPLAENNFLQHNFAEFFTISEIPINNGSVDLTNQQNVKSLYSDNDLSKALYGSVDKSKQALFKIGFKGAYHQLISIDDAFRLFWSINADYFKIDKYIVKKDNNYSW